MTTYKHVPTGIVSYARKKEELKVICLTEGIPWEEEKWVEIS